MERKIKHFATLESFDKQHISAPVLKLQPLCGENDNTNNETVIFQDL